MNTTIYVVRHGETTHNRDNILSGHVDPELTDKGKRQAEQAKDQLSHISFDEAYSSDLQRAVHTGSIIYDQNVPDHHQLPDLRERNYGTLDGKSNDDYVAHKRKNQDLVAVLDADSKWEFKHAPDIESDHELSLRFVNALKEIATTHPGKTILVAAHGGAIRTMLIKLGYCSAVELPSQSIDNAAFVELTYDGSMFKVGQTSGVNKQSV